MCGENRRHRWRDEGHRGSSPRVRGKPVVPLTANHNARLIPACAGKTGTRQLAPDNSWAHPRVCGENAIYAGYKAVRTGSSPRVRGKLLVHRRHEDGAGLIPACAGKTTGWPLVRAHVQAHPRVCGENVRRALGKRGQWGSSPRVRGKLGVLGGEAEERGLIPACAGKTPPGAGPPGWRAAHPRVCGENPLPGGHMARQAGSSPRVRGKLMSPAQMSQIVRLIPACAGKTVSGVRPSIPRTAHPRVCGENLNLVMIDEAWAGSSPRVRGKRALDQAKQKNDRLIPACAGKTAGCRCRPGP